MMMMNDAGAQMPCNSYPSSNCYTFNGSHAAPRASTHLTMAGILTAAAAIVAVQRLMWR